MAGKRESVFVGLFVIVAAAVLIGMVFAITGAFGRSAKSYHAYFPFAGGIEQGASVRYAGGPKVGRVDKLDHRSKESRPNRHRLQRGNRSARLRTTVTSKS